jgi:DNA-binding transcriptional MerR regulator
MASGRGRGRKRTGPEYLGTAEVADLLGVTTTRIRQLSLTGVLVEAQRVGGRRLYLKADVEAYRRTRATAAKS